MTDETRETLTKLLGEIEQAASTSAQRCDEAAALRDVLTPRTCSTCKHFVAWFKDGVTANGYPEKRGDCKHRSYLGRRNGQSPDDGCIRGWQAREGEGGTR